MLTNGMWSNFKHWICMVGLAAVVTAQQSEIWATDEYALYRYGSEFSVNSYITGDQRYPSVAFIYSDFLSYEVYVVAWETLKYNHGIAASVRDMYGSSWTGEFDVKFTTDAAGNAPTVTSFGNFSDARYVITWGGCYSYTGNATNVHAQVYRNFASTMGPEIIVNNDTSQGQTCPVAAGSYSGFSVAWVNKGDGSMTKDRLYTQRFNSSGGMSDNETEIIDSYTLLSYPSAVRDRYEGLLVTCGEEPWTDSRRIAGRYTNDDYVTQLYNIYSNDALFSSVANLSSGGYAVVWQEYSTGSTTRRVVGTVLDSSFYTVAYTFTVNTYNYDQGVNTSVFTDGRDVCRVVGLESGGFIVVWSANAGYGTGYDVYGQVFDNEGNRIGDEFRINSYSSFDQFYPSISVSPSGMIVVVWQSQYQDGDGYGIFGQLFQLEVRSSGSSTETSGTLVIVVFAIIIPSVVILAYLLYMCRSSSPEVKV